MRANVYLCGPSGAGKTTVAPLLAALHGFDAVDVDETIESHDGRRIARIVDEDGEPAFRERERATIAALAQRGRTVVALGGGALEDPANRRTIAASGISVFLDASIDTCVRRTEREAGTRPLLREPGALARLHAARRPNYLNAHVRVAVDGLGPDEVARAVDDALRREHIVRVETARPYLSLIHI